MTPFPETDAPGPADPPSAAAGRSEKAVPAVEPVADGEWRIVEQAGADDEEARFAVYRGATRLAWGIRDRATAIRWLHRLRGAPLRRTREPAASASRSTPERAWWLDRH